MANHAQLIPVLSYHDIPAAHDFLVNAFGFSGGGVERDEGGRPIHGEVNMDGATIWLHRMTAEHRLESPLTHDVANAGIFVYVEDVDAHFARAHAAGARIDSPPIDQPYGQREYGARDPEGHRWWFATPTTIEDGG